MGNCESSDPHIGYYIEELKNLLNIKHLHKLPYFDRSTMFYDGTRTCISLTMKHYSSFFGNNKNLNHILALTHMLWMWCFNTILWTFEDEKNH
jgi:hypothetical protein